ncbi:MAG TPA: DUF2628 domain-containing protein [Beijerinckiaceae bacterium]
MKTYTLHVSADALLGDAGALDRAVLVRDGFSWGAFFFSFLWFFVHRLWLAGLIVLVAVVGLGAVLQVLRVGSNATFWAMVLLAVLVGLEANSLRRWTLQRRGRPAVAVVAGRDREEAETKAFGHWLGEAPSAGAVAPAWRAAAAPPPATPAYRAPEPVIGLFPEAERPR